MARAGQFKPGGGRYKSTTATKTRSPRPPATRRRQLGAGSGGGAMVVVRETVAAPRRRRPAATHHAKAHKKRGGRRRSARGVHVSLPKLAATAVVLGNVAGKADGVLGGTVYNLVQKLPGTKTFGGAETVGLYCAAIHEFTGFGGRFRPWLKLAGFVGVIGAGLKLGNAGTNFKWLGDPGGRREMFDIEQR
jgi:hypothetical protein